MIVNLPEHLAGLGIEAGDAAVDRIGEDLARALGASLPYLQVSYSRRGEIHIQLDEEQIMARVESITITITI
jgi:hypothetical protein